MLSSSSRLCFKYHTEKKGFVIGITHTLQNVISINTEKTKRAIGKKTNKTGEIKVRKINPI